ncbi:hypothetical protein BH09BAC1_BH09BAC1_12070 [soil metagenome]
MERVSMNRIEKENIQHLQFKNQEVLQDTGAQNGRERELHRAMLLGNGHKSKVKIIFESLTGRNMVQTTIWATTDKNVVLKGGLLIPICCILEVVC